MQAFLIQSSNLQAFDIQLFRFNEFVILQSDKVCECFRSYYCDHCFTLLAIYSC